MEWLKVLFAVFAGAFIIVMLLAFFDDGRWS